MVDDGWNDMSRFFRKRYHDNAKGIERWRGRLFDGWVSPVSWPTSPKRPIESGPFKGETLQSFSFIEPPHSITFPICEACGEIVWDWPHWGEEVNEHSVCGDCFKEMDEDNHNERDFWGDD